MTLADDCVWKSWQHSHDDQSHGDSWDAFYDEQPLPASNAVGVVNVLLNPIRDQATGKAGDTGRPID